MTKELWDTVRAWGLNNGYTDLPVGNGSSASKEANHPVHSISWFAMVKWCNARSQKENLTPCYTVSGATYKTGSSAPVCNWNGNGYRLPSEAEWCWDWYGSYAVGSQTDSRGVSSGTNRVYRGGSWFNGGAGGSRVALRDAGEPASPLQRHRVPVSPQFSPLAEVSVSQLAPGQSVEIPLELPAGSQPEGERAYRVTLDQEVLSGDVDPTNNEVLFRLNLWIDADGDGLPNEWETANGLSDSNAADAQLDSDGDGFNNRLEYLAGTDPRSGASVLKIGEVARRSIANGGALHRPRKLAGHRGKQPGHCAAKYLHGQRSTQPDQSLLPCARKVKRTILSVISYRPLARSVTME